MFYWLELFGILGGIWFNVRFACDFFEKRISMSNKVIVDRQLAAQLGFPKLNYVFVELERRWICTKIPAELVHETVQICDLYVTGTCLRLREERGATDGSLRLRLSRKVSAEPSIRLMSSIYLQKFEFDLLKTALTGKQIRKRRHRLSCATDTVLVIDEFQGDLAGLLVLEAEFSSEQASREFIAPWYAGEEITDMPDLTGGALAEHGLPRRFSHLCDPIK
jgi:CYTH domain-containing protein